MTFATLHYTTSGVAVYCCSHQASCFSERRPLWHLVTCHNHSNYRHSLLAMGLVASSASELFHFTVEPLLLYRSPNSPLRLLHAINPADAFYLASAGALVVPAEGAYQGRVSRDSSNICSIHKTPAAQLQCALLFCYTYIRVSDRID